MAHEAAHSDLLQQLGLSYPQLIDYYSKAYTATLVGPTLACRPVFTYTDIGSSWRFGFGHMELHYYLVCILLPSISNIIDTSHSDGEMTFFWQTERRTRWSIARTLFMVVGSCTCSVNYAQICAFRTATSRSSHFPSTSTGALSNQLIILYV